MKRLIIFLTAIICLTIISCHQKEAVDTLKVGVIAGPESALMETAKEVAARNDLKIKIVQFSDYTMPNEALAAGSIDANAFQHLPYLKAAIAANGYQFIPLAKTFIYPMAIYSQKIKHISDLRNGAIVAIQNDPSNESRALLLLQKANLIKLKPNVGYTATLSDIISNPKKLQFKEIDAAQMARVLPDVDIATINTNYAIPIGLVPSKDGLVVEDANSPYTNLIVIRKSDKGDPRFVKLIQAFQSPEVIKKAQELFHGGAIPGWQQK